MLFGSSRHGKKWEGPKLRGLKPRLPQMRRQTSRLQGGCLWQLSFVLLRGTLTRSMHVRRGTVPGFSSAGVRGISGHCRRNLVHYTLIMLDALNVLPLSLYFFIVSQGC